MHDPKSKAASAKLTLLTFFSIAAVVISLSALGYSLAKTPKIAFIRSDELLNKYKGMQEAKAKFEEKAKGWQATSDTLKSSFEAALKTYEKASATMSASARVQKEQELRSRQEEYGRYAQALNQQAEQEDKKLTENVLAQVNAFLKVYGEKHGYDVIFGANGGGSIVHGRDVYDITDEVLIELNLQYEGN